MSKICCTKALGVLFFIFCSLIINGQEQLAPSDTLRNVRLREVVVTATQPDAPGTSSLIGQDAIRKILVICTSLLAWAVLIIAGICLLQYSRYNKKVILLTSIGGGCHSNPA